MRCATHPRIAAVATSLLLVLASPVHAAPSDEPLVPVIVKLDEQPLATYRGGIRGLAATGPGAGDRRLDPRSAAARAYRAYLGRKHAAFERAAQAAVPAARALYRYDVVLGGMAMLVPESAIPTLGALPGVTAVYRDELAHLDTDTTPAFIGAKAVWGKLGGIDEAGEGVIVGVLDTGIWPEHPSLSDPDPKGKPYTAPAGSRLCQFSGGANPGAPFACNGKLIGAYRFQASYDACGSCAHPADDFTSARDAEGHGTHTATTAAGNGVVPATIFDVKRGKVSGVAPRAHVIAYKVCGEDGCLGSDSTAAVQQAILDGVDVINFSISGGTNPYFDAVEMAFLDAYAAGVFVAASAGNDGPAPNTVAHRGGWVTTVAASTEKKTFVSKLKLAADDGAKLKLVGASITAGIKDPTPFILASSVGDERCDVSTPDGAFAGMVVGCLRGGSGRLQKSFHVSQRGAAGMILFNDSAVAAQRGLFTDNHAVPTVMLDGSQADALRTFAGAHTGITAAFTQGKTGKARGDAIAAFSSRGGVTLATGILKPDITAPGVEILAGDTPAGFLPEHVDGELFQVIAGTSMSSPHIAGAAALLRDAHPDWTPGQIKSAMMTTASTKSLVKEDGTTPFVPFDAGSGRIALKGARTPGATFDVTEQEYLDHSADLWNVNYPSVFLPGAAPSVLTVERTAHSEFPKDLVWDLMVITADPGLSVSVPAQITVPAGGDTTFAIGLDKSALAPGAIANATLQMRSKSFVLHLPITAVGPVTLPNLVITAGSASSPVIVSLPVTLSRTVQNSGPANAGRFQTSFFVSSDRAFSLDDAFFASCTTTAGLNAGGSETCSGTIMFNPSKPVPPGTYHVLISVDALNEVVEGNEGDNIFVVPTTITVN